jgi:hypothetical protein
MASTGNSSLRQRFDIDTERGFTEAVAKVEHLSTRNFYVEFDADSALCDVDLDSAGIVDIIKTSKRSSTTVRWLNFWAWNSDSEPAFEEIIAKYGISPRLAGLIWPKSPEHEKSKPVSTPKSGNDDLEKASPVDEASSGYLSTSSNAQVIDQHPAMGLTDVLNALWHFCSVDSDRHFRYIGCNQLYVVPGMKQQTDLDKPSGIRIWTSLILCDDGTVISVSEQPCQNVDNHASVRQIIRQNSINVFKHLSSLHTASQSDDSLHRVTIRPKLNQVNNPTPSMNKPSFAVNDASSILLYYLFDDWIRSFRLIAGFEHPYRRTLQRIRNEMFGSPDVNLIHSLHQVGKQLNVLKLMYQSYELIIERILYRQRMFDSSLRRPSTMSRLASGQSGSGDLTETAGGTDLDFENISDTNVHLCPAATVRFERLLDRVRLYALTEIENCLKEKEELVFMVSYTIPIIRDQQTK